jgi:thiamine-phosphate pyrophosphorylase
MKNFDLTLYLCTDRHWLNNMTLAEAVERAIDGGATLVQLREKDISTLEFLESARAVQVVCRRHGVPLIINDRIDIALAIDAEGVHVGQDDMPCAIARRILGDDKIIGVSVHTLEETQRAIEDGADYVGIGAVFMTATKQVSRAMTKDEVLNILENADIPACAIGGIDEVTGPQLTGLGLDGIAVISSILSRPDITEAARRMRDVAEMIIG